MSKKMIVCVGFLLFMGIKLSDCWSLSAKFHENPINHDAIQAPFKSQSRGIRRFLRDQQNSNIDESDDMVLAFSEDSDVLLFSSDWENNTETTIMEEGRSSSATERGSGWLNLPPKVRLALIRKGQQKAIVNKKKRESSEVKLKRRMMFIKKSQRAKKLSSKVSRPLPIHSPNRTSLEELLQRSTTTKMPLNGTVISLTSFGAYIDVNSACDGLLHISQMSTNGTFTENIRDVLQPGDILENCLYVYRCSPELSKLQLTMVPPKLAEEEDDADDDEGSKISLEELQVDDELWGEIQRVTNYGAFVELGAVVTGFLHFMDHPDYDQYEHPREFMFPKQRIRVWVSRLDVDRQRIQLTANRPLNLPQIRRRDDIPYSRVNPSN